MKTSGWLTLPPTPGLRTPGQVIALYSGNQWIFISPDHFQSHISREEVPVGEGFQLTTAMMKNHHFSSTYFQDHQSPSPPPHTGGIGRKESPNEQRPRKKHGNQRFFLRGRKKTSCFFVGTHPNNPQGPSNGWVRTCIAGVRDPQNGNF